MMFWKTYDEETSKQELMAVVKEMAALDNSYPELGIPSKVRAMMANGNFSIEERPWDFLIALGYSMINLIREQSHESGQAISLLQNKMERALKHPAGWMIDAITPEVEVRYLRESGENLPQVALPSLRAPRNLKNKVFSWVKYAQLQYVLRRFCSSPFAVDLPTSGGEYWEILTVREMRDFVASMERPPEEILQELNQKVMAIELKYLRGDLSQGLKRAKLLMSIGYKTTPTSPEAGRLMEIMRALGLDVEPTKDNSKGEAAAKAAQELMASSL